MIWRIRVGVLFVLSFGFTSPAFAATTLNPTPDAHNEKQINAALYKGGVVHLNPGVYRISGTIYMQSGTTLEGDRGAKIVLADDVRWSKTMSIIRGSDRKNMRITGFEIDGNRDNNAYPYCPKSAMGHGYYRMFYFYNASNIEIDNMYLHDNWDDVVSIEKTNNLNFHDNIVRRPGHDIVSLYHAKTAYVTNNCMRLYGNSGARANGGSGPLYVINNDIARETSAPNYAAIESQKKGSVAYDCNNTIQNVTAKYAAHSGGVIRVGGCPVSPAKAASASSCNVADLAGTAASGTLTTGNGTSTSDVDAGGSDTSGSGTGNSVDEGNSTSSDAGTAAPITLPSSHILGAFSGQANPAVAQAVGLNSVLHYNYSPVAGDRESTTLKTHNLKIIDDMPDQYMRQFKADGNMTKLLSSMTAHLKSIQNNPQVIAFWMIDDWESNYGGAKVALQKMNALIHQYTPGKVSICGISGNSLSWTNPNIRDKLAANFSPEGCDMIGIYLYPWGADKAPMTNLPAILSVLKAHGWNVNKTPLVGIPQSYGGKYGYSVPTAAQVRSETKYFCEQGAKHIVFYDFHSGTSASNSTAIQSGIKSGLADCRAIWGD
jgi:hypothetical protein